MVQSRTKRRYKSKKIKYTRKYTRKKQKGGLDIKGKLRSAKNKLKEEVGDAKGSFDNYKDSMRLKAYMTTKGPYDTMKFGDYYPKLWTRINNNPNKDDKLKYITSRLSNDNEVMLYLYYITKFIEDFKLADKITKTGQSLQLNESTSESVTEPAAEPVAEPATEPATEPAAEGISSRVNNIEEKLNQITALLQNTASSE